MEERLKQQIAITETAESRLREQVDISTQIQARLDEQIERTSTAEFKLERSVELAAAIANSLAEGVYAFGLDGQISYVNPAAERMLGWSAADLIQPGAPAFADLPLRQLLNEPEAAHSDEGVFVRKDGSSFWASYTFAPICSRAAVVGGVIAFRDITELKRTQEVLRRAEKLASAGRMAAAMAHEINNPLQAVTNLHQLMKSHELPGAAREYLALAEKELRRIDHITQQHLHFYRESSKPVSVDICQILDEVVAIRQVQHTWPHAETSREYRAAVTVLGFPGEMRQLFSNLLANAVEAGATRVRIRVSSVPDRMNGGRRPRARITVADNASGIPASCRAKIFEPFFTTKGEKGSGLGLWVCQGIVSRHDGSLRYRTSTATQNHGTVMSIFFPLLASRAIPRADSICA